MQLRPAREADVDAILALNAASVASLSPLDRAGLEWLRPLALRCDVVEIDGQVAAFVVVIGPGADYASANYHWFAERFDDFCYLDRIVVGERWRRRGVGGLVYDEMERLAVPHGRLTCEVNAEPPNHASLAFHAARGYVEVGRLGHGGGKVTTMLSKELSK
jgi:uncharacterized protein